MNSHKKLQLLAFLKSHTNIVGMVRYLNYLLRKITSYSHELQYKIEWSISNPEHFDHFMDLHWQWHKNRASFPMERGVFSSIALPNSVDLRGNTLDLCCGDGFYTYYFYSLRSKKTIGIDFDKQAIKTAQRNFRSETIDFILGDIRKDLPTGPFRNIIWDAGIEHFTENEINDLMANIKKILEHDGILSGYTIKERDHGGKQLHQHEYEFRSKDDLVRFFDPYFKNIQVIETIYPMRTNYYFYASDGTLPLFSENVLTKLK